jgi:hypothetical protein
VDQLTYVLGRLPELKERRTARVGVHPTTRIRRSPSLSGWRISPPANGDGHSPSPCPRFARWNFTGKPCRMKPVRKWKENSSIGGTK